MSWIAVFLPVVSALTLHEGSSFLQAWNVGAKVFVPSNGNTPATSPTSPPPQRIISPVGPVRDEVQWSFDKNGMARVHVFENGRIVMYPACVFVIDPKSSMVGRVVVTDKRRSVISWGPHRVPTPEPWPNECFRGSSVFRVRDLGLDESYATMYDPDLP